LTKQIQMQNNEIWLQNFLLQTKAGQRLLTMKSKGLKNKSIVQDNATMLPNCMLQSFLLQIKVGQRQLSKECKKLKKECNELIYHNEVLQKDVTIQDNKLTELQKICLDKKNMPIISSEISSVEQAPNKQIKIKEESMLTGNSQASSNKQVANENISAKNEITDISDRESYFSSRINSITLQIEHDTGHSDAVRKMIFIENDSKYITCSSDHSIRIFNAQDNNLIKVLQGHTKEVNDIVMLSNGYLASCSRDYSIKLWNIVEGTCVNTLTGHKNYVEAIIEAKNSILISGSFDDTIGFWDLKNNDSPLIKIVKNTNQQRVWFHTLCLIDDNNLAVGSVKDINIYKLTQPVDLIFEKKLKGHTKDICVLQVINNKEILISGSEDNTCKSWSIATGECLHTFTGHTSPVRGLVVLSETLFATSDADIRLWSLKSNTCLKSIKTGGVGYYLGITKDLRLFSCNSDKKVMIYKF